MTLEEFIKVVEVYEPDLTLVHNVWSSGHTFDGTVNNVWPSGHTFDGTVNIRYRDGRREAFEVSGARWHREQLAVSFMQHVIAVKKLLA